MKFFVAFTALVALASAGLTKPTHNAQAELEAIIAAIHSPSTDPATAALLEQQLQQIIGGEISVGPAIVEEPYQTPSIAPAFIEEAYQTPSIAPALVDLPVQPAPVIVGPANSPLVQIIVNVKQTSDFTPVEEAVHPEINPSPVIIVDEAEKPEVVPSPVIIVDEAEKPEVVPSPVIIVDEAEKPEVVPSPVIIVDEAPAPVAVDPVIIGEPVIPAPVINVPEILN